jgi:hypothetical protein
MAGLGPSWSPAKKPKKFGKPGKPPKINIMNAKNKFMKNILGGKV